MNNNMKHPPRNIDLTCFNWVKLILKTNLPANAKYVGLYLSTYMNANQDMAFPSLKRIEGETSLSHPSVIKYLNLLENEGWIIKQSGSRTESNRYWINIPKAIVERVGKEVTYVTSGDKVGKEVTSNNNTNNKKPYRGTQIGDNFTVTTEMMAWVELNSLGHVDIIAETDQFIDYNKGKGNVQKDWKATWRNWIRNANKFSRERESKNNGRAAIAAAIRGN